MSFHDEPLVFDNGPFGVDIGRDHNTKPGLFVGPIVSGSGPSSEQQWVRKASDPTRILLQVKRKPVGGADPEVDDFTMTHVHTRSGVTFTLKAPGGGSGGAAGTLTLTWSGVTEDELTIGVRGFTLNRTGRRLKASVPSLRIAKVDWNDGTTNQSLDLNDGTGGVKQDNVVVALF